jgi:hypothetical protein
MTGTIKREIKQSATTGQRVQPAAMNRHKREPQTKARLRVFAGSPAAFAATI